MAQNILDSKTNSMDSTMNNMDSSMYNSGMYENGSSMNRVKTSVNRSSSSSNNSRLMRGVLIGGVIGGVLAMLDSNTRTKVKDAAVNVKDSSMNMISEVKNNPSDVKDQMVNSFKDASNVLKEAISDAQKLYERLNRDMFGKMGEVKEMTTEAMNTAMDAKEDLADIGSKVKEAGSAVMDNPVVDAASETGTSNNKNVTTSPSVQGSTEVTSFEGSTNPSTFSGLGSEQNMDSNLAGDYATGMDSQPADKLNKDKTNSVSVNPENQNNDNNR
jgi:gas vesicle protein